MKVNNIILFVAILYVNLLFAQTGWHWQQPLPQGNSLNDVYVFDPNTLIAVGDFGTVMKSNDGGNSWYTRFNVGNTYDNFNALSFVDYQTGYVITDHGRVFKTSDGGDTWTLKDTDVGANLCSIDFSNPELGYAVGDNSSYVNRKAVAFRSETNGEIWERVNLMNYLPPLKSVKFINNRIGYIVGEGGTILKNSVPDTNWIELTNSSRFSFKSVFFQNANLGWATGGLSSNSYPDYSYRGKILKSTDGGTNWVCKFDTNYYFQSLYFINADTGWAVGNYEDSTWKSIICKTIDGGENWDITPYIFNYKIKSIYFQDYYSGWVVGWDGAIYKSSDGGILWVKINVPTSQDLTDIQFTDQQTGYSVITFDQGYTNGRFIKTTDGGQNWNLFETGFSSLNSMFFINGNLGWSVGGFGKIIKSTNGDVSWISKNSPTGRDLNDVFFINHYIGWIVGDKGQILKTYNGGENWYFLQSNTVNDLNSVHFTDPNSGWTVGELNTILSTTDGGGPVLSVEKDKLITPEKFIVNQNYPNPFNNSTIFEIVIPVKGTLQLQIFDITGKKVYDKNIGDLSPAVHKIQWNGLTNSGIQVASGIYFYRFIFEGNNALKNIQTRKMMLLR